MPLHCRKYYRSKENFLQEVAGKDSKRVAQWYVHRPEPGTPSGPTMSHPLPVLNPLGGVIQPSTTRRDPSSFEIRNRSGVISRPRPGGPPLICIVTSMSLFSRSTVYRYSRTLLIENCVRSRPMSLLDFFAAVIWSNIHASFPARPFAGFVMNDPSRCTSVKSSRMRVGSIVNRSPHVVDRDFESADGHWVAVKVQDIPVQPVLFRPCPRYAGQVDLLQTS